MSTSSGKRLPNRRTLAAYVAASPQNVREADLARAQRTLYEIDDADMRDAQEAMARSALAISPLCADAYCVLAAHAGNAKRARALYALGVAAGELALGPDAHERYRGRAWLYLDVRPYLRARCGLALRLAELGDDVGAIAHLQAILDLNPGDNQGARYPLLAALLRQGDDDGVAALLDGIGDEGSLAWVYTRALMAYRKRGGDDPEVDALGRLALSANPHVPELLALGLPVSRPNLHSAMGGPEDAAAYVAHYGFAWSGCAVPWLLRLAGDDGPPRSADEG